MYQSQFIEMFGDTHKQMDNSHRWREVVTIINGKDYKSVQVDKGGYPVYGTGGEIARASEFLCPENSVLIGRKGTIDKPLFSKKSIGMSIQHLVLSLIPMSWIALSFIGIANLLTLSYLIKVRHCQVPQKRIFLIYV